MAMCHLTSFSQNNLVVSFILCTFATEIRNRVITITFNKNLFGYEAPKLSSYTLALGIFMAEYER